MKYSQSVYTKAYAKAYLDVHGSNLSFNDIEHMKKAMGFLKTHHNFMSLVNILVSDSGSNHMIVKEFFQHFSLHQSLYRLFCVLKEHKKTILFAQVLQDICCLYLMRNNILEVTIVAASLLSGQELQKFETFFQKRCAKQIVSTVQIDSSLIAGVRMQSDFYMWEYSVASRLKKIQQNMLFKG